MKRWPEVSVSVLFLLLAVTGGFAADGPQLLEELDKALAEVKTWEHGAEGNPLRKVEEIVMTAAKDAKLRAGVEDRLVATLKSSKAVEGRVFLCRQLRTICTVKSIPALEPLLTDQNLSHAARYVLGRLADDSAAAALHRAMGKTSGKMQAGIISTLSKREYSKALPDFEKLVKSSDTTVSYMAVFGLGRLGGSQAVNVLKAVRAKATGEFAIRIDDAILMCASKFRRSGQNTQAIAIYKGFYSPSQPARLRLAALTGLATVQGAGAASIITEAIKSDDAQMRASAIACMSDVTGAGATKAFIAMLPSLPPESQELVIRSLGARGDRAAAAAITKFASSQNEQVRLAALEALGSVGDSSSAAFLAKTAAASSGAAQEIARGSLLRLGDKNTDAVLAKLTASDEAKVRIETIRALRGRGARTAASDLFKVAAGDSDASVRREAIGALGVLSGEKNLAKLLGLLVKPADRAAVELAVATAFLSVKDSDVRTAAVLGALGALGKTSDDTKPSLVRLLANAGSPKALDAVRAAVKDKNPSVNDAAVRTLANWPDASPADEVLAMVKSSPNQTHRVLLLRGYIRMAAMSKDATKMFVRAMDLAKSTSDKKLVLSGLGSASSIEALELVEKYIDNEAVQSEAAMAATQIAEKLLGFDATRAKVALKKVIDTVKNKNIRQKAQDVINETEKHQGYVMTWVGVGPYVVKGKEGSELFDIALPPEKGDKGVKWAPVIKGLAATSIDLENAFGEGNHCACYLRASVWSPVDQTVRLELGSDDAIKVWINGKKVHGTNKSRGMTAREDLVATKLAKGANVLLMKVIDYEGGWSVCCRIRKPDGSALEGLKVEGK